MSIYCTSLMFEEEGWDDDAADLGAPLIYRRSHVLPSMADPRGGVLDLAYIPGFITRDGRDDRPEDDHCWPYLRLSLQGGGDERDTVVLDVGQVEALHAALGEWLSRVDRSLG